MKIEQLISAVNESINNEAFSDLARKEKELAANRTAPVTKPTPNFTVVPGGKGAGAQTQQATNPVSFGKGTAMPINPITVPGAGTSAVPATTPTTSPTTQPTTTPDEPGKFKKAWDYANSKQSGADLQKFGAGMADAGASLSRGAQTVAQGTGNLVKGVSQGAASAVKGIGDVACQAVGGAAQTVGAGIGGAIHGFKAARAGQQFGGGGTAGAPGAPVSKGGGGAPSPQSAAGADAGGSDELAQLKSTLQTMDQRLRRAGI
jgi:hypothetical protein